MNIDEHLHIIVHFLPPDSECEHFVESGESDDRITGDLSKSF
jgi:hypothetical protein